MRSKKGCFLPSTTSSSPCRGIGRMRSGSRSSLNLFRRAATGHTPHRARTSETPALTRQTSREDRTTTDVDTSDVASACQARTGRAATSERSAPRHTAHWWRARRSERAVGEAQGEGPRLKNYNCNSKNFSETSSDSRTRHDVTLPLWHKRHTDLTSRRRELNPVRLGYGVQRLRATLYINMPPSTVTRSVPHQHRRESRRRHTRPGTRLARPS